MCQMVRGNQHKVRGLNPLSNINISISRDAGQETD